MHTIGDSTILIVDDTEANIDFLVGALGDQYNVMVAMDGTDGIEAATENPPDLILLDVIMPGINGFEVCKRLKKTPGVHEVPIIFLTAITEVESKSEAFSLGAVDYITKPFEIAEVQARVKTHLTLVQAQRDLKNQNQILEEKVLERTLELARTQDVTITSLASLAETRDNETGGHIRRTQSYVQLLANELLRRGRYNDFLDHELVSLLYKSAPLHDIGKVGVPDNILLKPGKLTDEEFEIMKKHTVYGRDAIMVAEGELGTDSFLRLAHEIAYSHHEKWDGSGYPLGVKEDAIPLCGRLMAIADVYDALISERCYKPPMPHSKAMKIIQEGKGTHFDPELVEIFEELHEEFRATAIKRADSETQREMLRQ